MAESLKPLVGDVWETRCGYWVHLLGSACGPFPLIGRVFLDAVPKDGTLQMAGPLWAFSREGVSCDADDRGFDLVRLSEAVRKMRAA